MHLRVHCGLVAHNTGAILLDGEVWHVYTFSNGLIQRMDIHESRPA